jgi:serine/threonine protein kinase
MVFPLLSEYIDAILTPEDSFEELKDLHPVLNETGRPVMSSGNFAVVFKMEDTSGKQYALKCFLREQEGREQSYKLITRQLDRINSSFFLKVKYLDKEIFVDTSTSKQTEFPVLLMDWVEGKTLDKYIREHIDSKFYLADLAYRFSILANWLSKQSSFAHGDIKPDNIIVKEDGELVLVDYDGMFVPGMSGQEAREIGSPDFRHPNRTNKVFDSHIDDFSLLSILFSLKLISHDPYLLCQYGAQDRLLFSMNDYLNPDACPLLSNDIAYDSESRKLLESFRWCIKYNQLPYYGLDKLEDPIMQGTDKWYNIGDFAEVKDEDLDSAWIDHSGVKYSSDRVKLLKAPNDLVDYVVLDGTRCVCNGAFANCSNLKRISFPSTLERIGSSAFSGCKALKRVVTPFRVRAIGDSAFYNCEILSDFWMNSESLKCIGRDAFRNCKSLEHIEIPDSVSDIGSNAFENCNKLLSIRLPVALSSIEKDTFAECTSLSSISLPSIKSIGKGAFRGCSMLRTVYIPDSVKRIDDLVFQNCSSLNCVRFPSLLEIGSKIFDGCDSLVSFYGPSIPDDSPDLIVNGRLITISRAITDYDVPESVTSIPWEGFSGNYQLKSIRFHGKITSIGGYAFQDCVSLESVLLPSSITELSSHLFSGCKSLRSILIPEGVQEICDGVFCGCESLNEIQLPSSLKSIGKLHVEDEYGNYDYQITGAFYGCKELASITIPNSVTLLGASTFQECESLNDVHLSDGLEYIGDYAFCRCRSLKSIDFPESILSIGASCFYDCDLLMKVIIRSHTLSIGYRPFENCYSLESFLSEFSIDNKSLIIDGVLEAFAPKDVSEYSIPDGVTRITRYVFNNCEVLEQVRLPDSIREIGYAAFADCTHLSTINIPKSVTKVEESAFENCPCEKDLVFPNGIEYKSDPYRWLNESQEHQFRI